MHGVSALPRRAFAEQHIGKQYAEAGAGVGFNQEENRAADFLRLRDTKRRENTVVNGIVQEQNLRRFDENRRQRQQMMIDEEIHASSERCRQSLHRRADGIKSDNGEQHADDASGKNYSPASQNRS